jgi:hypothetical protein
MKEHKIYTMPFKNVYPHYVTKVTKKGKTEEDLLHVINWLTGYTKSDIQKLNEDELTFEEFFNKAPKMNDNRNLITGSICGHKVQEIKEPLMKSIRQLDKIIDELAKGKSFEKIFRQ